MGVKLVVAVTDWQWFDLLRGKPELPEVNFWAPIRGASGRLGAASCFSSSCTRPTT